MNNHLDAGYAEAVRRRALRQPPSAVTRRARSLASAITLVAIGVILAIAYQQAVAKAPDAARAKAGLVEDIKDRSASTDQLQRQADRLREQVAREREAALADTSAGKDTAQRLRELESVTGLGSVSGPGLVVTAGDGPPPKDPVTGELTGAADPGRLLDRDLQDLVNGLWRAGAEAIAIDGQRLTPTATIRLAGEAILVDLRPVSSPYRIEAIGDPGRLDTRFSGSSLARRFRGYIQRYGMSFSISRAEKLKLTAAAASSLQFAHEQGASPSSDAGSGAPATPDATSGTPSSASPSDAVPSPHGGGR